MNFGISGGGIGLIGGFILFGAAMLAFTIVAALFIRAVRSQDDAPPAPEERKSQDEYNL